MHRYPPAVWNEDEEEDEDIEWDDEGYDDEDPDLAEDFPPSEDPRLAAMEPDDGMSWEDGAAEAMQAARTQGPVVAILPEKTKPAAAVLEEPIAPLRTQTAREKSPGTQDAPLATSPNAKQLDPAQATETRKLTVTPSIARDDERARAQAAAAAQPATTGPLLPSAVMQQQAEERKRTREEIEALEEAARKKALLKAAPKTITPSSSSSSDLRTNQGAGKLRKEREREEDDSGKKKKGGMLAGLFGRRKDKDKGKGSAQSGSDRESLGDVGRTSEESGRSSGQHPMLQQDGTMSPTSETARLQQATFRNSTDPKRAPQTSPQAIPQSSQQQGRSALGAPSSPPDTSPLSQHASTLRQRDQQQQALYQQYLNRSPSSPPEAQPSFGYASSSRVGGTPFASSASTNSGLSAAGSRPRPHSLVLSSGSMSMDGQGVPELSVIRVFAGKHLQTEATFKTVLLNASTRSDELVRQAMQRFRLPAGEEEKDYYLTVKQVEGSSAVLRDQENPLVVFDSLVEAAMELPKVKRSSVGSISSVASNLSMHPAIKKLPMNDFTDDSAVKFYLNRRSESGRDTSLGTDEGDDTIVAEMVQSEDDTDRLTFKPPSLYLPSSSQPTVGAERFSSPSYRFPLQIAIYPEDLPEDMVFDPHTEAIVFKNTLKDRRLSSAGASLGVSQTQRKKVFMFPKNVTVAEVIELGLERFGILEGVVDGGDEVEDKLSKRQSSLRVRYMLRVDVGGQGEQMLELWSAVAERVLGRT